MGKPGRPKKHKITIDQRKDRSGYNREYYNKRTKPLKLEDYLAGAKAIAPPKKKKGENPWSF